MVQRILEPGQIESLDHSSIPRIRLPERATVFATRAARMRKLSDSNPIGGYIRLMASLADDQQKMLSSFEATMPATSSCLESDIVKQPA